MIGLVVSIPFVPFDFEPMRLYELIAGLACIIFGMAWYPCCCPPETCDGNCEEGTVPTTVQIDFSGVADDQCTETNCSDFDLTTWVLTRDTSVLGGTCCWSHTDIAEYPCQGAADVDWVDINFCWLAAGDEWLQGVTQQVGQSVQAEGAANDLTTPPVDCSVSILGEAMFNNIGLGSQNCDWSSATVDITFV